MRRISTPDLRSQSGMAIQTSPRGIPEARESRDIEAVRHDIIARQSVGRSVTGPNDRANAIGASSLETMADQALRDGRRSRRLPTQCGSTTPQKAGGRSDCEYPIGRLESILSNRAFDLGTTEPPV